MIEPVGLPIKFGSPAQIRAAIAEVKTRIAKGIETDYLRTVRTWKTPVQFKVEIKTGEIWVHPDYNATKKGAEIYGYVDLGTAPHVIRPRKAKALHWKEPFAPKTHPGAVMSFKGVRGPTDRYAMIVHHPGTAARGFSDSIQQLWGLRLIRYMERALANIK